jgi:hypothetical protein
MSGCLTRIFPLNLMQFFSQSAGSPAHRGYRANNVFGSVSSVGTAARFVIKEFQQESVMDAG